MAQMMGCRSLDSSRPSSNFTQGNNFSKKKLLRVWGKCSSQVHLPSDSIITKTVQKSKACVLLFLKSIEIRFLVAQNVFSQPKAKFSQIKFFVDQSVVIQYTKFTKKKIAKKYKTNCCLSFVVSKYLFYFIQFAEFFA
jgi:hypothetical protein